MTKGRMSAAVALPTGNQETWRKPAKIRRYAASAPAFVATWLLLGFVSLAK